MFPGISRNFPKNPTVDTPSPDFALQYEALRPCRDLMGGTEVMRAAGDRYIQKKEAEAKERYEARVQRTVLRNIFAQTVAYNRGQVFGSQVVMDKTDTMLTDEQLEAFKAWAENVDQQGSNLTSWAGGVFSAGLIDGVSFALVDYPSITTRDNGGIVEYQGEDGEWRPKTAEADRAEGWQPYLVHVPASQVLDCRAEWRKGRRVITHFRYIEQVMEQSVDNPWKMKSVAYIHAYWPDKWQVWCKQDGEDEFTVVKEGRMTLDEIPVAVFVAGQKRGAFTARPALMDLAWLNIRHWQATSEQCDLLSYARLPVWYASGVEQQRDDAGNEQKITLGPGYFCTFTDSAGKIANVGVDPASVEAGRNELKDLEESMAAYGLQLLKTPTGGKQTATEVERDSRENNSQLVNWALDFQDFLENVLRFVALWWGIEDGPSVKVNDDFAASTDVNFLKSLHDSGVISKATLATLLVRAKVLPDDFDFNEEAAKLAQDVGVNGGGGFNQALSDFMARK